MDTQYPPLNENQMPQWSRIGQLDKSRYPKPFSKDQLTLSTADHEDRDFTSNNNVDKLDDQHPALRICTSSFVTKINEDDDDTSIEESVTEEKEESFKNDILLDSYLKQKEQVTTRAKSGSAKSKTKILEKQILELKHQVRELKNKNEYLTQLVDKNRPQDQSSSAKEKHQNEGPTSATVSELSINMDKITFTQHSRTVLVHDRVGSARRRPNQEELEKIINHLHRANQQQESELTKVKSDLKEVLYSHKWTPDAYLLAKAYVAADGAPEETDILPKLQMRSTTRKLPDIAYISRDNVSLPALKNTMGTKAVERRKRTQILQKARLHKEVL
ncbi:CCDC74B [Bugula neritina]|uniref:CCDC74B n=1 Tax=Bugula neritina TaxID=10212 RepID=A0A7J7IZD8_BUGNE|nr:CCDC74B [Bugula neritina]